LPLLAFTLRELWAHRGDNGRLEITTYRSNLGGLDGSVARAAEDVLAARPLPKVEEADLRTAFLLMVSINDEGQFVQRPVRWDALPLRIHPLLERLVQARLLVSLGAEEAPMLEEAPKARILEVAHEALFRNWSRLALPSSRVIPVMTCPALRPRWCPEHLPWRTQDCCLPAHANRRLSPCCGISLWTTTIPISGLYHAACHLAPPRSAPPLLVEHVGFATDQLARR